MFDFPFPAALHAARFDPPAALTYTQQRHAFLTSRLDRRWSYNRGDVQAARRMLNTLQAEYVGIVKRIEHKRFNTHKFATCVLKRRGLDAPLLYNGLRQIDQLVAVFVASMTHPPTCNAVDLLKLKNLVQDQLAICAPAYDLVGLTVVAGFTISRAHLKLGLSLSQAGYTKTFITALRAALRRMARLINQIEHHDAAFAQLRVALVTAGVSNTKEAAQYVYRHHEMLCRLRTSILTSAPWRYLRLAVDVAKTIAQCYQ